LNRSSAGSNRLQKSLSRLGGGGLCRTGTLVAFRHPGPSTDRLNLCLRTIPDGTVIWTSPSGDTYVTTPGSALLFPSLCAPTGELPVPDVVVDDRGGERTAMMPISRRTRAQNRAHRIAAERRQNQRAREARRQRSEDASGTSPTSETTTRRLSDGTAAADQTRAPLTVRAHNWGARPKSGEPR
jgi:hypothetical protein